MQPIEHNYSEKRDFIRMKLDTPEIGRAHV